MTELKGVELVRDLIAASVTASREAAQIIRDVKISGELNVQEKSEKTDYVTKADIEAQKCIVEHLKHFFPDIKYRGEEGSLEKFSGKVDAKKDLEVEQLINRNLEIIKGNRPDFERITQKDIFVWIDPLDGTREYVETEDTYLEEVTVLIGIAYRGRPIAGVINQPFYHRLNDKKQYRDGIVWAFVGLGVFHNRLEDKTQDHFKKYTFKNEQPRVPSATRTTSVKQAAATSVVNIASAVIQPEALKNQDDKKRRLVTSRNHATDVIKSNLAKIPNSQLILRGGCGFKIIVLLDGKADCYLYPSRGTKRWDSCAPEAIVRALGGECTDVLNERYDYSNISPDEYENVLGLVAAFEDHSFYIKNLSNEIIGHVWQEAIKPKREKKSKKPVS